MKNNLIALALVGGLTPSMLATPTLAAGEEVRSCDDVANKLLLSERFKLSRSNVVSENAVGEGASFSFNRNMKSDSFNIATDFRIEWNSDSVQSKETSEPNDNNDVTKISTLSNVMIAKPSKEVPDIFYGTLECKSEKDSKGDGNVIKSIADVNIKVFAEGVFNDTDNTEGTGNFSIGFAFQNLRSLNNEFLSANIEGLTAKWETDQDFDTANLVVSYDLTPTSAKNKAGKAKILGFDQVMPLAFAGEPTTESMFFSPSLNLGLDLVNNIEQGSSGQRDTTALRVPIVAQVDFYIPFFNNIFRSDTNKLRGVKDRKLTPNAYNKEKEDAITKGTKIFFKNTLHYTPDDQNDTIHNYFQAGAEYPVDENIGFSVAYNTGQLAPSYKNVENFLVNLTARF